VRSIILFAIILLLAISHQGYGQFVVVPIQRENVEKEASTHRTKSVDPVLLPFWDDFSSVRNGKPRPDLWEYGQSVWVNDGMGIHPPSLNVATFDGLDSLGRPYNVNDVLAKGYADKLVSAPIRMDLVSEADKSRIFISFFYQYHGNGEPPDAGDLISLSFKNSSGNWEVIWSKENDGTLAKDKFEQLIIPITDQRFFHSQFQFKIENFARLSGPYDTWHVDYIYLNNGKLQANPVRPLFPDRAITTNLSSTFASYWSMPIRHFFSNFSDNYIKPSLTITNLRQDQVTGNGQPVSYNSAARITTYKNNEVPVMNDSPLDTDVNIGSELTYQEQELITLTTMPDAASFDSSADSIKMKINVIFDTGDNKIKTATEGDYDYDVFNPIEFRTNDSISIEYELSNYYAYDDGRAEYGAGLNQPGAQLAYEFNMMTDQRDTIVAVDIYFPRFGDDSNQVILFQVMRSLTNTPSDIIFSQSIPIQRNTENKFWRISLGDLPAGVKEKFYIGWKQNSSAVIAVGLDKNTDTGNKIYANINGTWEQNLTLKGSLMIRPIFGKGNGEGEVTGSDEAMKPAVFPNPSQGIFTVAAPLDAAELVDLAGRSVAISTVVVNDLTQITIQNPVTGVYLLRTYYVNKVTVHKIMVK